MSEQLKMQGPNSFIQIKDYKVYIDVGATTLNQHMQNGIIRKSSIGDKGNRKPDQIITKKHLNAKKYDLYVIGEGKDINKFDNDEKRMSALNQAIEVAELFKNTRIPLVYCTDGSHYIYAVLKQVNSAFIYQVVKREDGYIFSEPLIFDHKDNITNEESINLIEYIINSTDDNGRFITQAVVNPSNLAKRVWQKAFIKKKSSPAQSLSLFIEIFVLKYLSDLGVLNGSTIDKHGMIVNFNEVFQRGNAFALSYYENHARPHIKEIFPANTVSPSGYIFPTTIINGMNLSSSNQSDCDLFYKILDEFNQFPPLNNINKDFKTRLFEDFLKGAESIAERGQYFTPRKVVQAIIDMADIQSYKGDDIKICDPACGVGGFILEAMDKVKSKIKLNGSKEKYSFKGFDINEDLNHSLTGVLGKANCLIYMSDKISQKPTLVNNMSSFMNDTFFSYKDAGTGSLIEVKQEEYDLILTNPPYVVNGSKDIKNELKSYNLPYKFYGSGIESIFLEKIVLELKQSGKAFIVVPDGSLNRSKGDKKLRDYIYNNCYIEGIIGLPVNTFFNTPKKTYILIIKKMNITEKLKIKNRKTMVYDAQSIGEKLDATRFDDFQNNDLQKASSIYKNFVSTLNGVDEYTTIEDAETEFRKIEVLLGENGELFDESKLLDRDNWIFRKNVQKDSVNTDELISKLQCIKSDIYSLINSLRG